MQVYEKCPSYENESYCLRMVEKRIPKICFKCIQIKKQCRFLIGIIAAEIIFII